mgnify:CR=1 FL=1
MADQQDAVTVHQANIATLSQNVIYLMGFSFVLGSLFGFGVILVILQSLLDVVFIVAMVNVGAKNLPVFEVVVAVLVYATAALAVQIAIVAAYAWAGPERRARVADTVTAWLDRYGQLAAIVAAIGVGAVLVASGVSALNGGPSLG